MIPENPKEPTILIVDDTPENIEMLNAFLNESGFRISVARSAEEALQRVEHVLPDIILLDVLMPGMDGFETCRRLKACNATRDIPVIFLTAISDTVEKVKGFDLGGVDFLTKPVQHEEVLARVNAHLTIRKLQLRLQKENERFQKLAEATFEGIVIHDEGRILEVNQTIAKMFDYQRSEIPGKHVLEFVTPESRQTVSDRIQTRDDTPYEVEGLRRDGSSFPIEVQARTIPYEGREVRVVSVRDLSWRKAMEEEKQQLLRETIQDRYKFGEIIGKSHAMQESYELIMKASASDANVLICGESGTGKELVAQTIHQLSERKEQMFVAVNCGAVPETLFESEFFGHRKGAFTGATTDKLGYFDRAHKGTVFLDEVGELHPSLQVKLLRALQEREYTPLGDTLSKKVDVRIIAATNKDLKEQLQQGLIREDFFYRIRVIVINLPPLRDRKEDIPLLIDHFLQHYRKGAEFPTIPAKIMDALCMYHWPGNVRELQNELQRYLTTSHLELNGARPAESLGASNGFFIRDELPLSEAVEAFEQYYITRVLNQHRGQKSKTAVALGMNRKTLYKKLKKYGVL